jgi:thioredoxin-like negative regulator of GroEL
LSMPAPSNFELRMRDLVLGTRTTTSIAAPVQQPKEQQQQLQRRPGHVLTIETLQDFKTVVGEENEKLVVVRFYASYCKVCTACTRSISNISSSFCF